jgi:hypothetical protein
MWHFVGDDGASVDGLFDLLSQVVGRWWCAVSGVFVCVWEFVGVVVSASARYVPIASSS